MADINITGKGSLTKEIQIVILAAGKGSRMQSDLPKVMHQIAGVPMLDLVLQNASSVTEDIILVHSTSLLQYITHHQNISKLVLQEKPLGTAHALYCANKFFSRDKIIMVLYGDNPLITPEIIEALYQHSLATESSVSTLAFYKNDPAQYGRIIIDEEGNFIKIVEFKNANEREKKIQLCNSGIMAFTPATLMKYLPTCISDDTEKELYLTKIIEICSASGEKVSYFISPNSDLLVGVNTQEELRVASKIFQNI